MKINFFALFFLFAFSAKLPSATADFVQDVEGNLMQNGGSYYILPVIRGNGGGLGLAKVGNETCPLTVAQARSEMSFGSPVKIASPYLIAYIYEGLILQPAFVHVPTCANTPSYWTITEESPDGLSVKITGYDNTVPGWFRIEKYLDDYKLVFCSTDSDTCSNLGIYTDNNGENRLIVTNDRPFNVMFKKVDKSAI